MEQVNSLLIASGGGTDAFSIMNAKKKGGLPEIGKIVLVSTHEGAGCLERAVECGVESITLAPRSIPLNHIDKHEYRLRLSVVAHEHNAKLLFSVGCRVVLPLIPGVAMYNIHPADPEEHGGDQMYGLYVHEHVLKSAIDKIKRGKKRLGRDRFFTHPTVHEMTEIPDDGQELLRGTVEIPTNIIERLYREQITLRQAAELLQQVVLPYEWQMLPTAVGMAARRILLNNS